jgi:hypothetical protein
MPPVGASISHSVGTVWNATDVLSTPTSVIFALDVSGSMSTGTRLADLKSAVTGALESLREQLGTLPLDIGITAWSSGTPSLDHRHNVTDSDIDGLIAFVAGLTTSGQTNFNLAFSGAADFYANSPNPDGLRLLLFVTDGEPVPQSSVNVAVDIRDSIERIQVFGVNIDLENTQFTEIIDNTPEFPVPVIQDGEPDLMLEILLGILGFRTPARELDIDRFTPREVINYLPTQTATMWTSYTEVGGIMLAAPQQLFVASDGRITWLPQNEGGVINLYYSVNTPLDLEDLPEPIVLPFSASEYLVPAEEIDVGDTLYAIVSAAIAHKEEFSPQRSVLVSFGGVSHLPFLLSVSHSTLTQLPVILTARGVTLTDDGTVLWVMFTLASTGVINFRKYVLSVPYDLSTAVEVDTATPAIAAFHLSFTLSEDQDRIIVSTNNPRNTYELVLEPPGQLTGYTIAHTIDNASAFGFASVAIVHVFAEGAYLFVYAGSGEFVLHELGVPWDLSTLNPTAIDSGNLFTDLGIPVSSRTISGLIIQNDGRRAWVGVGNFSSNTGFLVNVSLAEPFLFSTGEAIGDEVQLSIFASIDPMYYAHSESLVVLALQRSDLVRSFTVTTTDWPE